MKRIYILPLICLIVSCSSSTTPAPTITSPPVPQATLIATSTPEPESATNVSLEVIFDGDECVVHGPSQLDTGVHEFVLRNQSGERAGLWTGRLYPEKDWEDFLQWFQDNCGPPGSLCPGTDPSWIAWLFEIKYINVAPDEFHYQHDLKLEADYILVVSRTSNSHVWPCGTFQVITDQ